MVKRYLVTSRIKECWPDLDQLVVPLEVGCTRGIPKSSYRLVSEFSYQHRWNNRENLYSDFLRVEELYEKILKDLTYALNAIHNTNFSTKFWRIIVGPWLGSFIFNFYEKWHQILLCLEKWGPTNIRILRGHNDAYVPNGMYEFLHFVTTDEWNLNIISQIVEMVPKKITKEYIDLDPKIKKTNTKSRFYKKILKLIVNKLNSINNENVKIFFLETYLSRFSELKLLIKLREMPRIRFQLDAASFSTNLKKRKEFEERLLNKEDAGFLSCIKRVIAKQIPKIYLEGFSESRLHINQVGWPKKPKAIFTSNSYHSDDLFKIWAAEKIEFGTRLYIGQHGGSFGLSKYIFTEIHQIKISDCFFSWGWISNSPKVKPIGIIKERVNNFRVIKPENLILVTLAIPRYPYAAFSFPMPNDYHEYIKDQEKFIESLNVKIQKKIIIRLNKNDYEWNVEDIIRGFRPWIMIDNGIKPIEESIKFCRIYVSTYNATTFLESLSNNIPTVIYWNPHIFEIRESGMADLKKLFDVGILHYDSQAAAEHINAVWSDVDTWWLSSEVQKARIEFCKKYALRNKHIYKTIFSKISREL